jgi:hypothetical protein
MAVVVVLPWVPATAIPRWALNSSPRAWACFSSRIPCARAATSSGVCAGAAEVVTTRSVPWT